MCYLITKPKVSEANPSQAHSETAKVRFHAKKGGIDILSLALL